MAGISRRKLSDWTAQQLADAKNAQTVFRELGAYLIEQNRTRELDLIVRDVETALTRRGIVLAKTTSARALSAAAKQELETIVKAEIADVKTIEIIETIDESVIGGYKLELPGRTLDATVKAKLESVRI